MTANVRYEPLDAGLSGKYIRVIDYDASNDHYYESLDPNHRSVLIAGGLDPSESDPRFHQQMVYAVASKTVELFEFALGRQVQWGFNRDRKEADRKPLTIYPHAMQEANAFYSRDLKALVFGYFPASDTDPITNLPGQTVFTCLSHDIIAHETTHALIDGQRMYFMIPTNPDTLAFHEGFADIVALFQHFSFSEVVLDVIKKTGGLLYRSEVQAPVTPENGKPIITAELSSANPLVQLAKQFGEAMGQRAALRQAIGTPPNSNDIQNMEEPHDRGSILVAAIFDAFFTIYINRVQDLLKIAKRLDPNDIHPDIANRVAGEVGRIAENFLNICIRALDYCPPVDIRFGDFLRALITADYDLVRDDPLGYRGAFIDAFRLRGLAPQDVTSYSERSLRWSPPDQRLECKGLKFDLFRPQTSNEKRQNAVILQTFAKTYARELGLNDKLAPIAVRSFHPLHRVGPNGQVQVEFVAELLQHLVVPVDPSDPSLGMMDYYGGVTLIIDLSPENEGDVRYVISKHMQQDGAGNIRLKAQRDFASAAGLSYIPNVYAAKISTNLPSKSGKNGRGLDFSFVHRGF